MRNLKNGRYILFTQKILRNVGIQLYLFAEICRQ